MAIVNGVSATAANFNAAFLSKNSPDTASSGLQFAAYFAENKLDVATTATIAALASTKSFIKMTGSTVTAIQGITAGVDGQNIIIYNGSSAVVTISHQHASASAVNRIILPAATDIGLNANESMELIYDTGQSRWVIKSRANVQTTTTPIDSVVSKTANYTATTADDVIKCDASGGSFTITLYAAASNSGRRLKIIRTDLTLSTTLTIDGNASETINLALTVKAATQNESFTIECDGSNWFIVAHTYSSAWATDANISATGFGTVTNGSFKSRRVGDSLNVRVFFNSGTPSATPGRITFAASTYVIDTAKLSSATNGALVGHGAKLTNGALGIGSADNLLHMFYDGSTTTDVFMTYDVGSNVYTKHNGSVIFAGSGPGVACEFSVPISGWEG